MENKKAISAVMPVVLAVLILFFGYITFKTIPEYYSQYQINQILNELETEEESIYSQMENALPHFNCFNYEQQKIESDAFNFECVDNGTVTILRHTSGVSVMMFGDKQYRRLKNILGNVVD